jgi:hypothetical protein
MGFRTAVLLEGIVLAEIDKLLGLDQFLLARDFSIGSPEQ